MDLHILIMSYWPWPVDWLGRDEAYQYAAADDPAVKSLQWWPWTEVSMLGALTPSKPWAAWAGRDRPPAPGLVVTPPPMRFPAIKPSAPGPRPDETATLLLALTGMKVWPPGPLRRRRSPRRLGRP
jgi:hypothetical protein